MLLLLLLAVLCGSVLVGGSVVTVDICWWLWVMACVFTYRRDGGARVQRGKSGTGCCHHTTAAATSLGPAS